MATLLADVDLRKVFFNTDTPTAHPIAQVGNLYELISKILPNAYIIAGVILFIYLIAGGFMIITSTNDPEAAKNSQKIITNAIIGFIILFASYWIIEIIGIITGIPILNPSQTLLP